jgi:phosphatidylserine/phosphatidylglycerophosphate/cardiolipin synthase-like enzyme
VLQNGIVVKAYAGSTGVLLAFNLHNDADRAGLLGFAIQKNDGDFLPAMIPFPGQVHAAGQPIPTNLAPVQKFRWSDYTVAAATTYKYTVYAVRGTPANLQLGVGAEITVTTEPRDARTVIEHPDHIVTVSNRAVASSQAFSREFPETTQKLNAALAKAKPAGKATKTEGILTATEKKWLSNGLLEEIVAFIGMAKDASYALDVAIYQYELEDIWSAINAANAAGVAVRLIYHAKPNDPQTAKNIASAKALPEAAKFGRETNSIFHHKFIVLSMVKGGTQTPIAVLCGSTNFTSNGVYAQANNVQITSDPVVMKKYVDQFDFLFKQDAHTPVVTAVQDTEQNILEPAAALQVGFSPRNGRGDLTLFSTLINGAKQDVLFATAFGLDKVILNALEGQPHDSILRYGIQDKPTKTVTGLHADRTADFEAASTLPTGLDGWLDEHRTPGAMGNILIHDKIIVIDFTSDAPVVINGSHNYSNNASAHNDENYLIVRGNVAMADCLGIEVMRLYDHYRFRFVSKSAATKTAGTMKVVQKPMTLDTTNGWTDDYYDATRLKYVDRMLFSGVMHGGAPSLPPPGGSLSAAPSIQQVRAAANAPGTASATMPTKKASTKKAAAKKPNSKTARKLTTPKKTVKKSAKKRSLAAKKAGTQAKGKVTAKKSAPKKAAVTKSVLAKKK